MFPNNMEFFVRERLAKRYAEAEKHRLGQELTRQGALRLKLRLSQVLCWLGGQLIGWSEMLRYLDKISAADQPGRSTP
jgi:hypothetical protein